MRVARQRLIELSLLVLDQAREDGHKGTVQRTFAIRLALACLCELGTAEQWAFENFWRELANPHDRAPSREMGNYLRATHLEGSLSGISRGVGVERTAEVVRKIERIRRREGQGDIANSAWSVNREGP